MWSLFIKPKHNEEISKMRKSLIKLGGIQLEKLDPSEIERNVEYLPNSWGCPKIVT